MNSVWKNTGLAATIIIVLSIPLSLIVNTPSKQSPKRKAEFVGGKECISCHQREYNLWKGSDHDNSGRTLRNVTSAVVVLDMLPKSLAKSSSCHPAPLTGTRMSLTSDNRQKSGVLSTTTSESTRFITYSILSSDFSSRFVSPRSRLSHLCTRATLIISSQGWCATVVRASGLSPILKAAESDSLSTR